MIRPPPRSPLFPYPPLSRSLAGERADVAEAQHRRTVGHHGDEIALGSVRVRLFRPLSDLPARLRHPRGDRKSTRLNSSHGYISYAVFCLKKKKKKTTLHHIY